MVQHQVLRQVDDSANEALPHRRIILVTSALPQEGKSFIALNLAHAIATRGARPVLLVDADGQAGSLTALLGSLGLVVLLLLAIPFHRRPGAGRTLLPLLTGLFGFWSIGFVLVATLRYGLDLRPLLVPVAAAGPSSCRCG